MIEISRYKFYVGYYPAIPELNLEEEAAGQLVVVDTVTGYVAWFDNDNEEWHGSMYSFSEIADSDEYEEVGREWNNGYVSGEDAVEYMQSKQ